jgi:hypothetical protein
MEIVWDGKIALTPQEASAILRKGDPSIAISAGEGKPGLGMNSFMLQPGEDKIIADQLVKVFREHSS